MLQIKQLEMCVCKTLLPPTILLSLQNDKFKEGHNSLKINLIFFTIYSPAPGSSPSFMTLAQIVFKISCSHEKHDKQVDGWTNEPKAICPFNFFEVGDKENYRLTLKGLITTAADNILIFFFFHFSKKLSL